MNFAPQGIHPGRSEPSPIVPAGKLDTTPTVLSSGEALKKTNSVGVLLNSSLVLAPPFAPGGSLFALLCVLSVLCGEALQTATAKARRRRLRRGLPLSPLFVFSLCDLGVFAVLFSLFALLCVLSVLCGEALQTANCQLPTDYYSPGISGELPLCPALIPQPWRCSLTAASLDRLSMEDL